MDFDYEDFLLQKLISQLILSVGLNPGPLKPGYYIEKLSKEDRELLKTAKSKDFYHRIT
jgi:hypothetical protein